MKFGKEFVSQMVPEWQEAYMDYGFLKTLLKEIQIFKHRSKEKQPVPGDLKRKLTLRRAFSGLLAQRHLPTNTGTSSTTDIESQEIVLHSVRRDNSVDRYQTTFLMLGDEGGEYELVFFRRLDDEFGKVLRFYKSKVEEVVKEAANLNTQMDALIAFRNKVLGSERWSESDNQISRLASDVKASASVIHASTPASARASRRFPSMDAIDEDRSLRQRNSDDSSSGDDEQGKEIKIDNNQNAKQDSKKFKRPLPIEILDRVKINNILDTPRSTIKGVLSVHGPKVLKFNSDNLKKVENQLKLAFIEFYNKLRLLKSYSFLNILAFSKIMKKYDKITSRYASRSYLRMVDNSYLGSSEEVVKLMDRVEATFIKHFVNGNRDKGMNTLRPKMKKERHVVSFFTGVSFGGTVALLIALILIIRARNIVDNPNNDRYMDNMFPLYSLFAYIVFHMLLYAGNIYFWRKYRVNYTFILGFKEGTQLGYREILLLSFSISVLALGAVLANLDMEMDPKTKDYKAVTELVPLALVVLFVIILFCPLNIIYRSSRYFFLGCLWRSIAAPLYKVTLPDFLLADQLTSQFQALRSLEFYICYYGWGDYKHRQNTCQSNDVYNTFYFILAAIPFWWRFLQCVRRCVEERDTWQGLNAMKYFSTIVAICARTAYTLNKSQGWNVVAWITSIISGIAVTYWDIVIDWGLLQRHSKNRWLRDKLLVPHKSVYHVAMVSNMIFRFAWFQIVLDLQVPFLHRQTLTAIVAAVEILRRGVWNFFRLENEHLNNVGNYRAFKSVPLPFNYEEDEEKDD